MSGDLQLQELRAEQVNYSTLYRRRLRIALKGFGLAALGFLISVIGSAPGLALLGLLGYGIGVCGVALGFVGVFGALGVLVRWVLHHVREEKPWL